MTLPENLNIYVNCVIDLTKNIKILGTDGGLYSYHHDQFVRIENVTDVHYVTPIPNTNHVIMIVNAEGVLITCDLNHLINLSQCASCTKPTLIYKKVFGNNSLGDDNFHFVQTSRVHKDRPLFFAATSQQLVIADYDLDGDEFRVLRVMDTAEPISCGLFTEHTLIVGADKFFEIDLATFQAEEFIDLSDVNLKHVKKCYRMKSFPLGVMQVSENPKEYLLCFNEFSLFVDEFGRSSRSTEIVSTFVPIGFYFVTPFLYVVQFGGVQIFKVGDSRDKQAFDSCHLPLKQARFVGVAKGGIYIWHDGKVKLLEGRRIVPDDNVSQFTVSTEDDCDSNDGKYSLDSSLVNSMENGGGWSDGEGSSSTGQKTVTFSQTNL